MRLLLWQLTFCMILYDRPLEWLVILPVRLSLGQWLHVRGLLHGLPPTTLPWVAAMGFSGGRADGHKWSLRFLGLLYPKITSVSNKALVALLRPNNGQWVLIICFMSGAVGLWVVIKKNCFFSTVVGWGDFMTESLDCALTFESVEVMSYKG